MSEAAEFRALARTAASSYPRGYARHFAYGKLTGDPVFKWIYQQRLITTGTRVLDLGCGQGLLAALHFAARVEQVSYTGIDLRSRDIERARLMAKAAAAPTAGRAQLRAGDIRFEPFPESDLVVMLDVLHYVDYRAQASIFDRATDALAPGGKLLLRVADNSQDLRFKWTILVDRWANRLRGTPIRRVYCRSLSNWREHLQRRRLVVTPVPMSKGTLFANVVLVARYDS